MPDLGPMPSFDAEGRLVPLGAALQSLPLAAPPRDAWSAVAPRRAGLPRWIAGLATAAALALAFVLPVPRTTVPVGAGPALAELQQASARLERLVAAANEDPLQPADALVLSLGFEDEIAGIDAGLAVARPGSRDALELWQRRVDVLSRYAELQSSRRLLASAGQPFETTLVALH